MPVKLTHVDDIRSRRPFDADERREVDAMKQAMEDELRRASSGSEVDIDLIADEPPRPSDTMPRE